MKAYLAAVAFAAALAQPAAAVTFPTLTTTYVGSGVIDDGGASGAGIATAITCSNVSGSGAQVRFLILNTAGGVEADLTANFTHGSSNTVATHGADWLVEGSLATGAVSGGVINIESTESGVFCSAMLVNADGTEASGIPLRLVRVNAHPGTEE